MIDLLESQKVKQKLDCIYFNLIRNDVIFTGIFYKQFLSDKAYFSVSLKVPQSAYGLIIMLR